ncbi:MAG: tetratricopeptide repeat protein [Marinilabiliaceae bacterium]|jgi:tetratricopeptide (TPR) repeat protein|nr:tetratricopeptide repeat protein [Marinilabiliaceae bacterium]
MRKLLILMLAGALSFSLYGQNPKKFLKAGETFMKNQRYEDAVAQFTTAIQLSPTSIDGYLARGEAYEKMEMYEQSYQDFEKARVFDDKDVNVLYLLGRICNKMGKYDEGLMHLNKATTLAKRESKLYPEKVRSLLGLERYDRALQVSDTALLLSQDEVNLYQRGLAFDRLQNYRRAKEDYEKAIRKNKEYVPARLAIAEIFIKENKLDEAMEHCNSMIEEDDRNAAAYTVRSKIYKAQLDYPSAINDISRNILIEPEVADHYATRGDFYQEFNQHANAVNDYSKAISLKPELPDYYFERAESYEQLSEFEKAQADYEKITVLSEFNMHARQMLAEVKGRMYEINRETDAPKISLSNPLANGSKINVRGDSDKIIVSGSIEEVSPLKSLIINGNESIFERGSDGVYEFLANINIDDATKIEIVAFDDYDNRADLIYEINRTEVIPPEVTIIAPFTGDDGQIMLERNDNKLYVQGKITDDSRIKSIFIDGVTASYAVNDFNPDFNATIDILNKNQITVIAEDEYGNRKESQFRLNRSAAAISENNPMGRTWVVFIENSNYESFASLDGPIKDINLMKGAFANYDIHQVIHKKDLTRDQMERFFALELRDQIRSNQVNSLLIWYAGHGKFVNDIGYWVPIDARRDDEFSYYSINTLRAAMEPYANYLTHMLVVTDACEAGPGFYTAMRSGLAPRSCDNYTDTQAKSSQVFSSAGEELASDDSQFTRTFANALIANPNACVPIEEIVSAVSLAVIDNNQQKPQFGKIKGLRDENGTFFFIAK